MAAAGATNAGALDAGAADAPACHRVPLDRRASLDRQAPIRRIAPRADVPASRRGRPSAVAQLSRTPLAVAAIAVLIGLGLAGLAADWLAANLFGVGPTTQNLRAAYARPDFAVPSL